MGALREKDSCSVNTDNLHKRHISSETGELVLRDRVQIGPIRDPPTGTRIQPEIVGSSPPIPLINSSQRRRPFKKYYQYRFPTVQR